MNIKIIVATHKKYRMPEDKLYIPVQVGAEINPDIGYAKDNEGDNISVLNKNFCELTGMYWAWKNLNADYIGLCHYRRYFKGHKNRDKWIEIATKYEIERKLLSTDVILPVKRNYYIETNYSQYVHAHHKEDLEVTRKIIETDYPEYLSAYDHEMEKTSGHRFNMFIMKKNIMDSYCEWLFDILFKLKENLDISDYSDNDKRVFGFVSERLLDVWIYTNNIKYEELPVVNMEDQHWIKKCFNFLKRKFIGKGKNNA